MIAPLSDLSGSGSLSDWGSGTTTGTVVLGGGVFVVEVAGGPGGPNNSDMTGFKVL